RRNMTKPRGIPCVEIFVSEEPGQAFKRGALIHPDGECIAAAGAAEAHEIRSSFKGSDGNQIRFSRPCAPKPTLSRNYPAGQAIQMFGRKSIASDHGQADARSILGSKQAKLSSTYQNAVFQIINRTGARLDG